MRSACAVKNFLQHNERINRNYTSLLKFKKKLKKATQIEPQITRVQQRHTYMFEFYLDFNIKLDLCELK